MTTAVVRTRGDEGAWCRSRVPDHLGNQSLLRHDNQITAQEMWAVVFTNGYVRDVWRGALLLLLIDDDGVRHALRRGTGGPPAVALLGRKFWLRPRNFT